MTCGKDLVEANWKEGGNLPRVSKNTYLGIHFTQSGTWDVNSNKVLDSGKTIYFRVW